MPELLEERQAKVEATLEQMDKRLTNVEMTVRELNTRIDALTNTLSTKIDSNFRWTIGIMITMWVTVILTILFKG
jgi:uncharacterized coiled-coil protein SlyX